jgi:hypothetical protein
VLQKRIASSDENALVATEIFDIETCIEIVAKKDRGMVTLT